MYYLYNVLIYLAAPFAILVQLWRGLRGPKPKRSARCRRPSSSSRKCAAATPATAYC